MKSLPITENTKELVRDLLAQMPEAKQNQLHNACLRNYYLTSVYGLEDLELTVYVEGWRLVLRGTRCEFSVWAFDRDGAFEFGRKPSDRKLRRLYSIYTKVDSSLVDYNNII